MAVGWTDEISGTRRIVVIHPDRHRFFFEFPEGWQGGHVLQYVQYQPVVWAKGKKPDVPWLEAEAAIMAISAARAQGWIESPRPRYWHDMPSRSDEH